MRLEYGKEFGDQVSNFGVCIDGFGTNDLHMVKANPVRPAQSKGAWLELEAWPADGG